MVLLKDGTLIGWGKTDKGQLLEATKSDRLVMKNSNIRQVFLGMNHSVLLLKNGTVLTFGEQGNEETGDCELKEVKMIEPVLSLIDQSTPLIWSPDVHERFNSLFDELVFTFLLSLKIAIPKHLRPPKPIFAIILNHCIE